MNKRKSEETKSLDWIHETTSCTLQRIAIEIEAQRNGS